MYSQEGHVCQKRKKLRTRESKSSNERFEIFAASVLQMARTYELSEFESRCVSCMLSAGDNLPRSRNIKRVPVRLSGL